MKTQLLTARERLDIENRLLREMAWRYARLMERSGERADAANAKTVRIMMIKDGPLSHQRRGLVLNARPGLDCGGKLIYWIRWAGNSLAVDESECVRLNGAER